MNGADDGAAFRAGLFLAVVLRALAKHLCALLAQAEVEAVKNHECCRCVQAQTTFFAPGILQEQKKKKQRQTSQS